jgi:Xaa-Pro dipeptidase
VIEPIGNLERLRTLVRESPFECVVAVSPENVFFTSGLVIASQKFIRERLALVVWPKTGNPIILVCNIEEPQTRQDSWIQDVRAYVEFRQSPMELLAAVLNELGLGRSSVGLEKMYLMTHYYEELVRLLPHARFGAADELLARARAVKTEAEIERLKRAAGLTEKALLSVYATIAVDETEKSMANRLASSLLMMGAEGIVHNYINAGPNTGFPHNAPSSYRAVKGDIVKSDVGGFFEGYVSDVARTGVIGKPSDEQASIYGRLLEIHHHCIDKIHPGNRAADVFETMKAEHARLGIHFPLPHAGHSVGITGHEEPILNPMNTTELEPNMVFYVETRARWTGKVGYHIEDLILCTDGSPKVLTGFFDNSRLFEI